jgi:two-component system, chemotaxis family, chemotaxis protein CheY
MPLKERTLLLVEDEESIRIAVNFLLENSGYQVLIAGNGKEAISALKQQPVDLVITDIYMPDCDGIELLKYMKTNYPHVKSIAVSGGDPQFLKVSEYLGADKILRKPYGNEDLRQMIDELLV